MQLITDDLQPLDFGEPGAGGAKCNTPNNNYRLGLRVASLMGWPKDKAEREKFLASSALHRMGQIERAAVPENFPCPEKWPAIKESVVCEIRQHDLIPVGGYAAASSASPVDENFKRLAKRADIWMSVSAQLLICMSIAKHHADLKKFGASLSQSRYILECTSIWNRRQLEDNWSAFRSVAHLCAAVDVLHRHRIVGEPHEASMLSLGPLFTNGLPHLLAVARAVQGWGTEFFAHGQGEALLPTNHIWRIGDDTPPWRVNIQISPLEGNSLQALQDYQAPKRQK